MRQIIETFVKNLMENNTNEDFVGKNNFSPRNINNVNLIALVVSLILSQVLLLFFGKWLWNSFLVPVIPAIKPLDSIMHLLGISFLIKLLFN